MIVKPSDIPKYMPVMEIFFMQKNVHFFPVISYFLILIRIKRQFTI